MYWGICDISQVKTLIHSSQPNTAKLTPTWQNSWSLSEHFSAFQNEVRGSFWEANVSVAKFCCSDSPAISAEAAEGSCWHPGTVFVWSQKEDMGSKWVEKRGSFWHLKWDSETDNPSGSMLLFEWVICIFLPAIPADAVAGPGNSPFLQTYKIEHRHFYVHLIGLLKAELR